MLARRAHRALGLVLLLPLCGWAATGFVFFLKPGYEAAYGTIRCRTYPLESGAAVAARPGWLEMRIVRTVLGAHLLVRTEDGSLHLDPATREPRPLPDEASLRRLLDDSIASDAARYGEIVSIERREAEGAATARTTTGVTIDLNWATVGLRQAGRDTRRIDGLYRIHYLQWTGVGILDRALGMLGLVSLLALAALGVRLAFAAPASLRDR